MMGESAQQNVLIDQSDINGRRIQEVAVHVLTRTLE
jgi:hypothetical protein